MNQFKLVISYRSPTHSEIVDVRAETLSEAEEICRGIRMDYEAMLRSLDAKNVFISRRMCDCSVDQNTASSSFITTVT